ncbi:Integrase, catalytic core [Corchorus capsularis]|uniref:Integrase, catalytic core n=1 Tax=Corchorus capsularis TaxID=210143 RepID=A0A1R3J3K0_COCAP|nr:Integrase, catalytic core [Corchorus capsularis]
MAHERAAQLEQSQMNNGEDRPAKHGRTNVWTKENPGRLRLVIEVAKSREKVDESRTPPGDQRGQERRVKAKTRRGDDGDRGSERADVYNETDICMAYAGGHRPEATIGEGTRATTTNVRRSPPRGNRSPQRNRDRRGTNPHYDDRNRFTKYNNYTPLTDSRTAILHAVSQSRDADKVKWPFWKGSSQRQKQSGNRFDFHQSHGHSTEECSHLKDMLEGLVRQGYLKSYVRNDVPQPRQDAKDDQPAKAVHDRIEYPKDPQKRPIPKGHVLTIIGATEHWASSSNRMKAHMREVMSLGLQAPAPTDVKPKWTITFDSNEDIETNEGNDLIVVTAMVNNFTTDRILVDSGSAVDIIMYDAYKQHGLSDDYLEPSKPIYGFNLTPIPTKGTAYLSVCIGDGEHILNFMHTFVVVDLPSSYNCLIGRPLMKKTKMVDAVYCLTVKFPTPSGIGYMRSDLSMARRCHVTSLRLPTRERTKNQLREAMSGGQPTRHARSSGVTDMEVCTLALLTPEQSSGLPSISSMLGPDEQLDLTEFLQDNADVFAWTAAEMLGIDPRVASHRLNVDPTFKPISSGRYSTQSGCRTSSWLRSRIGNGECALTSPTSTRRARKTASPYPQSIGWLMPHQATNSLASWTPSLGITRFPWTQGIRRRRPWSEEHRGNISKAGKQSLQRDDQEIDGSIRRRHAHKKCNDGRSPATLSRVLSPFENVPYEAEPRQVPNEGETMYMYLAASNETVATVLVKDTDKGQTPIYYVSRILQGGEVNYSKLEKLAFALVIASRRLRQYFHSHKVVVLTDQPLKDVQQKVDLSGRLLKWNVELSEFGIEYQPRRAIKAQPLADFVAECTFTDGPALRERPANAEQTEPQTDAPDEPTVSPDGPPMPLPPEGCWELFVDDSSVKDGAGAGVLLISLDSQEFQYCLTFGYSLSNNAAEYEALIAGLEMAVRLGVEELKAFTDSQLIANQILGLFEIEEPSLIAYQKMVQNLWPRFVKASIEQVPRSLNTKADALSKLASSNTAAARGTVFMEYMAKPRTPAQAQTMMINGVGPCWMDEIVQYLKGTSPPADNKTMAAWQQRSSRYILIDDVLYKKSFTTPLLRCLSPPEAREVLKDIHQGSCGNHTGGRSLAQKALKQGYYWPTMKNDAADFVRRCDKCQKFAKIPRAAAEELNVIAAPWPFAMWGLDLIGPFPLATCKRKFAIVACDYFTKWVEAKPLASITRFEVEKFLWQNILCRFGVPQIIVSDNGLQLRAKHIQTFCRKNKIALVASSVVHPQTNGQVEAANGKILTALKKKLGEAKGKWAEALPAVLWGIRTTSHTGSGETPFNLALGTEAVISAEACIHTFRTSHFYLQSNEDELRTNLDLLEEARLTAQLRQANRSMQVSRYYNKRVRQRQFQAGDLVLRNCEASVPTSERKKLSPNLEGRYQVERVISRGAYKLRDLDGRQIPRTWNAIHLKKRHPQTAEHLDWCPRIIPSVVEHPSRRHPQMAEHLDWGSHITPSMVERPSRRHPQTAEHLDLCPRVTPNEVERPSRRHQQTAGHLDWCPRITPSVVERPSRRHPQMAGHLDWCPRITSNSVECPNRRFRGP